MKTKLFIIFVLTITLLLSGCKKVFHHFEFEIQGLEHIKTEEYLANKETWFLNINDVVLYHGIKAVDHVKYRISIGCISSNNDAVVTIKRVCLLEKESRKVIFSNEDINEIIGFEENTILDLYNGYIDVGYLAEPDYIIDSDVDFEIEITAEVQNNGRTETKTIWYPIDVVAYYTHPINSIT